MIESILNFVFPLFVNYIIPLLAMVVLLALFLLLTSFLCRGASKVYGFIYKLTRYILTPVRCLWRALERKASLLTRISAWFQTTPKGNVATIISVSVLFVISLLFLLVEGFKNDNPWGFISDEFLSALPVLTFYRFLLGDVPFGQAMMETTIISLCLYYINKRIDGSSPFARVLYNVAFVFIGWAIGQAISMIDFQNSNNPSSALLSSYWFDFLDRVFLVKIIYYAFALVAMISTLYAVLIAAVLALREIIAASAYAVAVFLGLALIGAVAPQAENLAMGLFVLSFIVYEFWRVNALQKREDAWDKDVDNGLDDIKKFAKKTVAAVAGLLHRKK